jgi:hypothetical protein
VVRQERRLDVLVVSMLLCRTEFPLAVIVVLNRGTIMHGKLGYRVDNETHLIMPLRSELSVYQRPL